VTDTEIRVAGMRILAQGLGDVEAERLVALIQCGTFDYTHWREGLDDHASVEEISARAMTQRRGGA
jgi:hypothetical protein